MYMAMFYWNLNTLNNKNQHFLLTKYLPRNARSHLLVLSSEEDVVVARVSDELVQYASKRPDPSAPHEQVSAEKLELVHARATAVDFYHDPEPDVFQQLVGNGTAPPAPVARDPPHYRDEDVLLAVGEEIIVHN